VTERAARPTHLAAAAPPSTNLPGVGGAAADPTFDLYKSAHQKHFVERDYAAALGAWDAYLKAAPRGALVPEARYNRALCLVRLHRNDEARAALKPFAEGSYGTYRRDDAQKLLEALPGGLVGPLAP
jgi:TolA-binding protein